MNEVAEDFVQSLTPAVPSVEDKGKEKPSDSQTENEGEVNGDGKKVDKKKNIPFHKHPEWIKREKTWNKRLEEVQNATKREVETLKAQISNRKAEKSELSEDDIPDWFNGDLPSYKKFYQYQTNMIKKAVSEAENNITSKLDKKSGKQAKEVQDATDWFQSEVDRMENDEDLNPSGEPINQTRLLEIARDEDLIDSKGRWNWKAAYRIYRREEKETDSSKDEKQKQKTAKKNIAALTMKKDSKSTDTDNAVASSQSLRNASWW